MNNSIFISYRRDDSRHAAGRLHERLAKSFHHSRLFMDISDIEPGVDFPKVIKETVSRCGVLLVVIGPKWLTVHDEKGARRLDDPTDFVRLELETALAHGVYVIPVLVDGTSIPKVSDLPEILQPLVTRNGFRISHDYFARDADALVAAIRRQIPAHDPVWRPPGRGTAMPGKTPPGIIRTPTANKTLSSLHIVTLMVLLPFGLFLWLFLVAILLIWLRPLWY